VEVIESGKCSSLLQYGSNDCRKKFYTTGPFVPFLHEILTLAKDIFCFTFFVTKKAPEEKKQKNLLIKVCK
jgi:hypothetical protein